jgi:oxygen-independent coproporphyrinogen-3 oxidase
VPSAAFAEAIEREWAGWQRHPAWDASPGLDTIYFGGGTPSRLDPGAIARLLARFRSDRSLAPGAEVTLEANPDDVSVAGAAAWRAAGVNRISLGAQSFAPDVLAWMHRTHDAPRIGAAVKTLRAEGFENLSLDLIYALPDALHRDWAGDLAAALALEPDHLSLYGLTVEPRTPLGRWTARGESVPAAADRAAAEYLTAHERLSSAGYEHYEVSNAGRPGFRARHNAAYWRRAPFIGLGPSAHSGLGATRAWNVREWEEYRRRSEAGRPVEAERETLREDQITLEDLYLGLRTGLGVAVERVAEPARSAWRAQGWAELRGDRLVLTPEGWLRLDALVASLTRC